MKNTMTTKKKVISILAAFTMIAAASATAFAFSKTGRNNVSAAAAPTQSISAQQDDINISAEVTASVEGAGVIEGENEGIELEFDEDFPMTSVSVRTLKGGKAVLGAKANAGWKFSKWVYADSKEVYSTDEIIHVTADKDVSLIAVFEKA
jgi:hypothetical protein